MSVYAFGKGPSYRAASLREQFLTALDQPMNPVATFFDQAKGGALESFGLGTVIRDFAIPQGTEPRQVGNDVGAPEFGPVTTAQRLYEGIRGIFNPVDEEATPLSKEAWETSPYFRSDIPWDEGMTEDRAAALATWYDARQVRQFFAEKRPIVSFLGGFAGQAVDPINYIPIAGPAVKTAAAARVGTIAGTAVAGAVDAAANTAAFGIGSIGARRQYGDDVSWEAMTSEIAMAAAIGGAFGGVLGAVGQRRNVKALQEARRRVETLENVQQARVALNEAIDGIVREGRVDLSPNGLDAMTRLGTAPESVPPIVRERVMAADDGLARDIRALQTGAMPSAGVMRRPVLDMLKRLGGIDPDSPIAAELKARGITSKTAPGLYRRQPQRVATPQGTQEVRPLRELDNIPVAEVAERFAGRGVDDGNGYVSRQAWIDALEDEVAGRPWLTAEEQRLVDEVERPPRELEEFMARWGIDYKGMEAADAAQQVRLIQEALDRGATIDPSNPRPPQGLTEEGILEWETAFRQGAANENYSKNYRINPETGDYLEAAEIEQVRVEGRLTEEDAALLDEQTELFNQSVAYGRALDAAVACLI